MGWLACEIPKNLYAADGVQPDELELQNAAEAIAGITRLYKENQR